MSENTSNPNMKPVTDLDLTVPDYSGVESEPTTVIGSRLNEPVGESAPTEVISAAAPAAPAQPLTLAEGERVVIDRDDVAMIDARRGTIDFGIFIIRAVFGAILIVEALKVFFNLGGSGGLGGLTDAYAAYQTPQLLAVLVPALQLTAGVFLLIGLLTPFAAALALAVTIFTTVHEFVVNDTVSFWAWPAAAILGLMLLAVSLSLQFTGPGKISLDFSRSWAKRPLASSWILVVVGTAAGVAMWGFLAGINPFALS